MRIFAGRWAIKGRYPTNYLGQAYRKGQIFLWMTLGLRLEGEISSADPDHADLQRKTCGCLQATRSQKLRGTRYPDRYMPKNIWIRSGTRSEQGPGKMPACQRDFPNKGDYITTSLGPENILCHPGLMMTRIRAFFNNVCQHPGLQADGTKAIGQCAPTDLPLSWMALMYGRAH